MLSHGGWGPVEVLEFDIVSLRMVWGGTGSRNLVLMKRARNKVRGVQCKFGGRATGLRLRRWLCFAFLLNFMCGILLAFMTSVGE